MADLRKAGQVLLATVLGGAGVPLAVEAGRSGLAAIDNAIDPGPEGEGYGYERRSPIETAALGALGVAGGAAGALAASPQHIGGMLNNRLARGAQRLIDAPMSVMERRGASPERLAEIGRGRLVYGLSMEKGAKLSPEAAQLFQQLDADPVKVQARIDETGLSPAEIMNSLVADRLDQGYSPEMIYALGRTSADNEWVRGERKEQGFGSQALRRFVAPIGAHAAVAGGSTLAMAGAIDVVRRMQAGEFVSEGEAEAADKVLKGS